MMVTTHGTSLRQGEGTDLTDMTMPTIVTASLRSPPTSPIAPTPRTSNQSESPSMTISKTHASGSAATLLPSRCQGDPTLPRRSTSRLLWNPRFSLGSRASKPNSIDSWEDLKRAFIDNFQGSMIRAGTRHDLS
jgi:hypothetical protein